MTPPSPRSSARRPRRRRQGATLQGRSLQLGDRRIPLISAAFHYWHVERSAWRRALTAVRDLGVPIVESYVPWGPHELDRGVFDFGERNPQLNLAGFLDLAAELGLFVFLRPGPHINAELTNFGIPRRIIHDPRCQAKSPTGRRVLLPFPPQMFPVPSYASERYREETGVWYRAVGDLVSPRCYPKGPVVLLQLDNEATFFFRNNAYDQDYHPDALTRFREFLKKRYGSLKALGHGYKSPKQWKQVFPPKAFNAGTPAELPPHLDWAGFQEWLLEDALDDFRSRAETAGLTTVPTVHNLPLGDGGLPASPTRLARVADLVGFDYYHAAREHRTIKRRTLYLAGNFELPYAPELGVGAPPWFTPLRHHDSLTTAMMALAYGLRGFNLYMGVDRDRWYGAPVDRKGHPRPEAAAWRSLIHALRQTGFHELRRDFDVLLVLPMEYRRLSRVTHLLGGLLSPSAMEALGGTPVDACSEDALGFKGPVQVLWWRNLAKLSDALTRAQVPYAYVDSEAPLDRMQKRIVLVPCYEFLSPALWKKLGQIENAGGQVFYGPTDPHLDERMQPKSFPPLKQGRCFYVDTPSQADALVGKIVSEFSLTPAFTVQPAPLECTVHRDELGVRVLFLLNPGRQSKTARLSFPGSLRFDDVMSGEQWSGVGDLEMTAPGLGVRMLRVTEASAARSERPSARAPARESERP